MRSPLLVALSFVVSACTIQVTDRSPEGRRPSDDTSGLQSSGEDCGTNRDCEVQLICRQGLCLNDNACANDAQCGTGKHCRHNLCHAECHGDPDCHVNEVCNRSTGACEYREPAVLDCIHSCECPSGDVCDDGRCVTPPARDAGTGCRAQRDCGAGDDCVDGQCRTPCTDACSCRSGWTCVVGYCQP